MFTFDGPNKLIIVDAGVTYFTAEQIYSDWKEWLKLSDNAKYVKAFLSDGRSSTGAGTFSTPYIFLTNDWKVRPQEANHTLTVDGNLLVEGGVGSPYVPTLGTFQVLIDPINRSDLPIVEVDTGTGGGSVDPQDIRDAMALPLSVSANVQAGSIDEMLLELGKLEGNRWKIENNQMTIYNDDGVTPFQVFNLFDASGNPTENNPVERVPTL
jgi:hypothetical protein